MAQVRVMMASAAPETIKQSSSKRADSVAWPKRGCKFDVRMPALDYGTPVAGTRRMHDNVLPNGGSPPMYSKMGSSFPTGVYLAWALTPFAQRQCAPYTDLEINGD